MVISLNFDKCKVWAESVYADYAHFSRSLIDGHNVPICPFLYAKWNIPRSQENRNIRKRSLVRRIQSIKHEELTQLFLLKSWFPEGAYTYDCSVHRRSYWISIIKRQEKTLGFSKKAWPYILYIYNKHVSVKGCLSLHYALMFTLRRKPYLVALQYIILIGSISSTVAGWSCRNVQHTTCRGYARWSNERFVGSLLGPSLSQITCL